MKTGIFETRRQGKTRGICVQNFQLLLSFRSRKNILVQTGFPKKDASCLKLKNISDPLIDDTEKKEIENFLEMFYGKLNFRNTVIHFYLMERPLNVPMNCLG